MDLHIVALNNVIRPALCLDLDGTIRHSSDGKPFISDPGAIALYPGVEAKLLHYKEQGYIICGITNQGGVAFGFRTEEEIFIGIERTIALFENGNPFVAIKISFSHERGTVEPYNHKSLLRKPGIGMLVQCEIEASENGYIIDWDNSLFVGDREEDEQCAKNAGIEFQWAKHFFNIE